MVVLKTERLTLEILQETHFDDLARLLANPIVHKYFPKTLNHKEAKQFYQKVQDRQNTDGHSFWAVKRKSDSQFLGICGLLVQCVDGVKELEVAYRFDNEYWGNGYASEAAKSCIDYARNILQTQTLISIILPINEASIRVAKKNGLRFEKNCEFLGSIVHVYRKVF